MAHWIAQFLTFRQPTLLWITEWGIWPRTENWHIYDKLRHRYGDLRLLPEVLLTCSWSTSRRTLRPLRRLRCCMVGGGHILTHANYVNPFFSHDEYIDFFAKPEGNLAEVREEFGRTKSDRLRVKA